MKPDASQLGKIHTVLTGGSETVKFQGWGQPHLERDGVVSQTTYLLLKHKPRVRSHRVTGLLYFFFLPSVLGFDSNTPETLVLPPHMALAI